MSGFFKKPEKPEAEPAPPSAPAPARSSEGDYMDRMIAARRRRIAPITGQSASGRYKVRGRWNVG